MTLPINLSTGSTLLHNGSRIKFNRDLGDDFLDISDCRTGGPYQVVDEATGQRTMPTLQWVGREFRAGRLVDLGALRVSASGRQAEFLGLDTSACIARDPKFAWRFRWTWAALKSGIVRSDPAYAEFISRRCPDLAREDGLREPGASTLRKWVRDMEKMEFRPGTLLSHNGRVKGQSQLPELDDRLVHEAAIYYWAEPHASVMDAAAYMFAERQKAIASGAKGLGADRPTYETVRLRVRSLESYDTYASKHGKAAADAKFNATGVSVEATRIMERVFIDGTELEQIAVMGSDWPLAASKMKCVYGMDQFSSFVFPPVVFKGPYREEMSMLALQHVMLPFEYTAEDLEDHPELAWAFGPPSELIPDNDRTLVGPAYIPGITALGTTVALPGVYHSDAKAIIENFHKFVKSHARRLPGTVTGKGHPKDPRSNPVADAELTGDAINYVVRARIIEWNTSPKDHLGGRSPLQVFVESAKAGYGPRLLPRGEVLLELCKTVTNVAATDDGIEHDGVIYRGDELGGLLSRNYRNTTAADRIKASAKCLVTIRTIEADIDSILVYDEENKSYITLYSTQPRYTVRLSRWEHNAYRQMARERKEKYDTEGQRFTSRAKSLRKIDETCHKLPFKRRNAMAALYDLDQVRRHSGKLGQSADFKRDLPESPFNVRSVGALREDTPTPPPGPKSSGSMNSKPYASPERPQGYYEDLGETLADLVSFDWDDVEPDPVDGEGDT
jgi:putative transposase